MLLLSFLFQSLQAISLLWRKLVASGQNPASSPCSHPPHHHLHFSLWTVGLKADLKGENLAGAGGLRYTGNLFQLLPPYCVIIISLDLGVFFTKMKLSQSYLPWSLLWRWNKMDSLPFPVLRDNQNHLQPVPCPSPTWLQASEDTLHCTHLFLKRLQGIFSKKMSLGSYRRGPEQSVTGPKSFSLSLQHSSMTGGRGVACRILTPGSWTMRPVRSPFLHLRPFAQDISWDDWEKAEVFLAWRGWIRHHCHHANMIGPFALQPSNSCRAKPLVRLSFALTFCCQLRAPRALHLEAWDWRFSSWSGTTASNLQFREKKAY